MNKFNYHTSQLWVAGFALLLSACTAETDGPVPDAEADTTERPLTVTAQLDAEVETRAASTTATALETGTMAVFRKTTNGYAELSNIPYSWDPTDKKWKSADAADKAQTIYVDHRDAEVYAYYPYDADWGTNTSFDLTMGRNTPSTTLLYFFSATQKVNNRTALVTFAMKSGYSRITFRLMNMNLPYCLIKEATVTFDSAVKTQGTIDISTTPPAIAAGEATTSSHVFSLTTDSIYNLGIGTGQWDETLDLLMIPGQTVPKMTIAVKLKLSGMLNNASTSVTIPTGTISGNLEQGKQYIIPLLVKGTTISLVNKVPDIDENTDLDPYGESKLTAYTLPPVTLADGLNVATGNLYYYESAIISTSKNPNYELDGDVNNWYCFAARNGKQWVEKDQGSTLVSSFSNTLDLCTRLGTNWRMPTKTELQQISNLTKTSGSCNDSGTGNVSGVWVGSYNSSQGNYQKSAVFFTPGTYISSDGGYLTVTTSSITYSASGASNGLVRCVSDQKY